MLQRRESRSAYLFIAPWVIGFLVFTAGPMVASLWLSFTDYSLVDQHKPSGSRTTSSSSRTRASPRR